MEIGIDQLPEKTTGALYTRLGAPDGKETTCPGSGRHGALGRGTVNADGNETSGLQLDFVWSCLATRGRECQNEAN